MGDIVPREPVSLADDEGNSVTVDVLGRDPRWSAGLDAEIVVGAPSATFRRLVRRVVSAGGREQSGRYP